MRIALILLILIFSIYSCSPKTTMLPIDNGYYFGKKRGLFPYYLILQVKDSLAFLETYRDVKGSIFDYGFHKIESDFSTTEYFPQPLKLSFTKDSSDYIFKDSSDFLFHAINTGEKIFIKKPIKIALKKTDSLPQKYRVMKNLALYTRSWYSPHIFLGHDKFDNMKKSYIMDRINGLRPKADSLEYEEYRILIKETVKKLADEYDSKNKGQ